MKKYFPAFIVCAVTTIFLIKVIPGITKNDRCDAYDEFLLWSFNGVVVQKYIDTEQHSYKTVVIRDLENGIFNKVIIDSYISNLYNEINLNDTLYKKVQNDSVFKITNRNKVLISKVDFGCNR
ncbi:MAG TPA: hypothetical protein VK498_09160 [Ferruginibacter sp.]|nr:hypothetical protein [Ferruginibacter sp.]